MKTKTKALIGVIAVFLVTLPLMNIVMTVYASENVSNGFNDPLTEGGFFAMRGWGMRFRRVMGTLSEEQRNELATEIQDLVSSKFEEWGIELPEPILSDEQRNELQAGIEGLREGGATREEIKKFIADYLGELGVELPELPEGMCGFRRGWKRGWKRQFADDTN